MPRNKYAVARRSIWYVLRTLVIAAAIIALCLGVFVMGMHVSNLYILATEGMEERADCILTDGSVLDLTEYFTEEFVMNDAELYAHRYREFTVSAYDYRLTVEGISVLPWNTRATMRVVESIPSISGKHNVGAGEGEEPIALPEWTTARYTVSFTRIGSRWYISGITLVERNPEMTPKATPDYGQLEPRE